MAKQSGIHGLRGKVNGMSYYGSKNGGALVRKINEGMSARVKSAKEYANTRKNNSEFGMCGDFAGAIIKPISLRWRFILNSIATGLMVKKMKELVNLDNSGAWGQRIIAIANFGAIREALNSFSKNEMEDQIVQTLALGPQYDAENTTISVGAKPVMSIERCGELLAEGVNYFYTKVFGLVTTVPQYDAAAGEYTKAETRLVEVTDLSTEDEITAGATKDYFNANSGDLVIDPVDTASKLGGLLVVFLPARKVGSSISILQEKCSAYIAPVTAQA